MGVRVLHLVRHGQAQGGTGGLTVLGRAQATLTAARLAASKRLPTAIVSSTLLRARQTAAILHAALPQATLRSTSSLCEGFPTRPPDHRIPADLRDIADDAFFAREARRHLRAYRRFTEVVAEAERIEVLVAHGNVIGGFVGRAVGTGAEAYLRLATVNAGLTTLVIPDDGAPVLVRFNDSGHLPPALVTGA